MDAIDLRKVNSSVAETRFAGHIVHLPSVGSTNALALEAAQAGAKSIVYVADEQTAGRGRGGHVWHSIAGDGLYVSALVTPPIPVSMAMLLPLITGLAAQAAILEATDLKSDIRWPNDLLLNGRKCGGILVETAANASDAMLRYAVIGIGINTNHESFPPEIASLATSLRMESGTAVSRERLLIHLLCTLEKEMRQLGEAGLLERFASASTWVKGKRVHVDEDGGYTGVTAGLDSRGFLRVASDDGTIHTVLSGGVREQQ